MPGTETVQIFGLIIQFLGEGLICFGIVGAISGKVAANTNYNRQILVATAVKAHRSRMRLSRGSRRALTTKSG